MSNTKMKPKCSRCGSNTATTMENILPARFISEVNYSQCVYPIVSIYANGRNVMPVCEACKNKLGSIMIPTHESIKREFRHFTQKALYNYANYIYENFDAINHYITEMSVYYNEEVKLFQVRMQYMTYAKALQEFKEFYKVLFAERLK